RDRRVEDPPLHDPTLLVRNAPQSDVGVELVEEVGHRHRGADDHFEGEAAQDHAQQGHQRHRETAATPARQAKYPGTILNQALHHLARLGRRAIPSPPAARRRAVRVAGPGRMVGARSPSPSARCGSWAVWYTNVFSTTPMATRW